MKDLFHRFRRGLVAALALAALAAPVAAQDLDPLVQGLAAKSFRAKIAATARLAETGDPAAAGVLEALVERRLFIRAADGRVVHAARSGEGYVLTDPATGDALGTAGPDALQKIRVNNRLRGAVRTALGGLTLLSKDSDKRISAAETIFRAPKPHHVKALENALAREQDDGVRRRFVLALAGARLLHGGAPETRIRAAEILRDHASPDVVALLRGALAATADPAARGAIEAALRHVEGRLEMWDLASKLFQGLSLGSVLLLAAIGLAITFGVMGVINMAHGEMVMLGAYTTFVVQELFRTHLPAGFDYSLAVAIPAAFVVAGAFGVAIERGIIRFLYGRPLETLLATWGLSLILQQLVRTVFGPTNREVGNPSWMTGAIELQGGVLLTYNRIWIIVFSLIVLALLALVLRRTALGLQMRAVTQNRRMAGAMGIRTGWVDAMTFGLGSGIAGMAGVALSQIDNVSPNLGQAYIVDSFMVVVFGGVGNLLGTLSGALTLGIANKFLEAWSGAVLAKILVLVAVILFIQKRPRGLFALRGRAVES